MSREFLGKLVSAENLEQSLSAGSKKRLQQYRTNLSKSQGIESPLFDDKVLDVIMQYALDPKDLKQQLEYLNCVEDSEGYKFSRNLKIYSKIEDSLQNFARPDHPSFRWNRNYQAALKELKDEFSRLKLRALTFNSDDEIKEALPKESTHSGFYWIISGNKRKGDNIAGLSSAFEFAKEHAMEEGSFKNPILIGFRTQASGEYEDDGTQTNACKHKTRLVSMYDLISIVNELQFSVPFQNAIAVMDFYAGGKSMNELSHIINGFKVRNRRYFSIDYSSFDSTISSWLIEDAFEIVRSSFKDMSSEHSRLFDVMVHDFIHKTFVLNEGQLTVHRGVPSGSMWTQIIDSIVNRLVVLTYFKAMGQKVEMTIMGDDNCIFTNYVTSIDVIATYIMKNFGLTVKVEDKSSMGFTNEKGGIKFLSRYWRWDGQYRDPHQLFSRLLFPERFRNYNDQVTPDLVVYAFILTYGLGMAKLINCTKFMAEHPTLKKETLFNVVDSRYLPGSLAFIKEYTRKRDIGYVA